MAGSGGRGGSVLLLLALLVLAGGAGAWNYHRNWQAEQAEPRPYRGYDDADLTSLIEAYEGEVERLAARHRTARTGAGGGTGGALLGDRVRAFDRARASGDALRDRAGEVAQQEAVLRDLQREAQFRAETGAGVRMHLRRLLTL